MLSSHLWPVATALDSTDIDYHLKFHLQPSTMLLSLQPLLNVLSYLPFYPFTQVTSQDTIPSRPYLLALPQTPRCSLLPAGDVGEEERPHPDSPWLSLWPVISCPYSLWGTSVTMWKVGSRAGTQIRPSLSPDLFLCPILPQSPGAGPGAQACRYSHDDLRPNAGALTHTLLWGFPGLACGRGKAHTSLRPFFR